MKNLKSKLSAGDRLSVSFPIIFAIIMMAIHNVKVVPQAIEVFNTYYITVLAYLIANATRLGLDPADVLALGHHMDDVGTGWKDLHIKHSSAVSKSTPGNHDLTDKERVVTTLLHHMYAPIDRRIMTNNDFDVLGIAKPVDQNSDRPKITNVPFAIMYSIRGAIVHFIVRMAEDSTHASMDPLADCIEVRGVFLAADAPLPTDPLACGIVFTSTSAIINHQFLPADAGKKFFCFIRYKNDTDEAKCGSWVALEPVFISK